MILQRSSHEILCSLFRDLKNANVTCSPAGIEVKRMSAIIWLPLISVLTTGFPREKKKYWAVRHVSQESAREAWVALFFILGGWLAQYHEPCLYQLMLRHVMLLALIPDPEGSRDVTQSAAELRGTAVQRPYMNWVLYPAVIFSTHFVSTKRGQRLETGGHQQSSNWGIPEELTLSQPGLTMCFNATLSPQAEGDWVRNWAAFQHS